MQLKADGVMGIAGCCIAVDVSFILDSEEQLPSADGFSDLKGLIEIKAKETLSYYDIPKMYADGIHLSSAQLSFQCIPINLTVSEDALHNDLIAYLYHCLDRKDPMGFMVYQAYCSDEKGKKVCFNIDLSRSFVFFDDSV